ncbi:MAG TPA: hypothetical protein VJR89_36930 [Polyangiales bacterium]|nr:hypothetical protein [Polyangiales bacterium]
MSISSGACTEQRHPASEADAEVDASREVDADVPPGSDEVDAAQSGDAGSSQDAAVSDAGEPMVDAGMPPMGALVLPPIADGACAFLPPSATSGSTGNPACPDGTFHGHLMVREAADLAQVAGCKRITGDVVVQSELSDLAGLEGLQVIEGSLLIFGRYYYRLPRGSNASLASLHGLEELRCVGRQLFIVQGDVCRPLDVRPLAQLVEVGGPLTANGWCEKSQLGDAFKKLQRVWGDLLLLGTPSLPELRSVYGRKDVGDATTPLLDYVGCGGGMPMCRDGILGCAVEVQHQSELGALGKCQIAISDLSLTGADISDLGALSKLREVRGYFGINARRLGSDVPVGPPGPGSLGSLSGLEALERVQTLIIANLPQLESLAPLSHLRELPSWHIATPSSFGSRMDWEPRRDSGDLTLQALPALHDLGGLAGLREVAGTFSVLDCDSLTGLDDLTEATLGSLTVTQSTAFRSPKGPRFASRLSQLTLSELPELHDVDGMGSVEAAGKIEISGCPKLTQLNGLSGLAQVETGLWIRDNAALTSVSGFSALRSVGQDLRLSGNALQNLQGLAALERAGALSIEDSALSTLEGLGAVTLDSLVLSCGALTDLHGLEQVKQVSNLSLSQNASLTTTLGLHGLTKGYVSIVDNPQLVSLVGLSELVEAPSLHLAGSPLLTTLHGLEALKNGGSLEIERLDALKNFQGLSALTQLDGLVVHDMPQLEGFAGMHALEDDAMSMLTITDNPVLSALPGLESVVTLGTLTIGNNPQLKDIEPLHGVVHLTSDVRLTGDFDLAGLRNVIDAGNLSFTGSLIETLDALQQLKTANALWIGAGGAPSSLNGPPALETLFGLTVTESSRTDLKGLSALKGSLHDLIVTANPNLQSLDGLQGLERVTQSLQVTENPALADLVGLQNISEVDQLVIGDNPLVPNLTALSKLTRVNYLTLYRLPLVPSYQPLSNLSTVTALRIGGSPNVTTLAGFENIPSLEELTITDADGFVDLSGAPALSSLHWLTISQNANLQNLNGLGALKTTEFLTIDNNAKLDSLRALDQLISGGTVAIHDNPSLFQCEVDWLANRLHITLPTGENGPAGTCPP